MSVGGKSLGFWNQGPGLAWTFSPDLLFKSQMPKGRVSQQVL